MKGQCSKHVIFDEAFVLDAEQKLVKAQENFVLNYWAFHLRNSGDAEMVLHAIKRWVRKESLARSSDANSNAYLFLV